MNPPFYNYSQDPIYTYQNWAGEDECNWSKGPYLSNFSEA